MMNDHNKRIPNLILIAVSILAFASCLVIPIIFSIPPLGKYFFVFGIILFGMLIFYSIKNYILMKSRFKDKK